jgi:cell division protein FtsZ
MMPAGERQEKEPVGIPRITVVGLGGGALRALQRYRGEGWPEIELLGMDTDARDLEAEPDLPGLRLGRDSLRGLGCGGEPEAGRQAAVEGREEIAAALGSPDLLFLVGCLGKGFATGALPEVAALAAESGAPCVVLASTPFSFEGERPRRRAEESLAGIRRTADCLIPLPNDLLFQTMDASDRADRLFEQADLWIQRAISGVAGPLLRPGRMTVDPGTYRATLKGGESRVLFSTCRVPAGTDLAAVQRELVASPLAGAGWERARPDRLLVSVGSGEPLPFSTFSEWSTGLTEFLRARESATVSLWNDPSLAGEVEVTLIARTEIGGGGPEVPGGPPRAASRSPDRPVHQSKLASKRRRAASRPTARQEEFDDLLAGQERGFFGADSSEPYAGIDLDKPTYLRRGIRIPHP